MLTPAQGRLRYVAAQSLICFHLHKVACKSPQVFMSYFPPNFATLFVRANVSYGFEFVCMHTCVRACKLRYGCTHARMYGCVTRSVKFVGTKLEIKIDGNFGEDVRIADAMDLIRFVVGERNKSRNPLEYDTRLSLITIDQASTSLTLKLMLEQSIKR
jgi:hypothetical protein